MGVNLSEGAVARIVSRQVSTEKDLKPVLQVIELKEVQTTSKNQQQNEQNQNQHSEPKKSGRYRLLLSDGSLTQQGMLATSKNELVTSFQLQVGSVVQLTQYICNVIQERMIVIIIELEVIIQKHDLIGKPVPAQKSARPLQVSTNQPGTVTGNSHNFGGSLVTGVGADKQNSVGTSFQQARMTDLNGTSHPTESESGGYGAANAAQSYPKINTEGGAGIPVSAPFSGPYGAQNLGYHASRQDTSRPVSTFNPQPPPAYQQPSPMYPNRGPAARNEAPARMIPIAALNPYLGRWTIKARVTHKAELRSYNNTRGEGKFFSFDLLDSDGGEIRVTCFNVVADQFYNQIEVGRVYLISKGSLKHARKDYNHLQNDHEILLDSSSIVQPCYEDDNSIPRQQFHFRDIIDVESMENKSVVDVIGVVTFISPATSVMRKDGIETQKRTLQLKDMSGRSVELTLWGNFCNAYGQRLQSLCDSGEFPVLAVKSGRVSDFNGKALGTISSSNLFIEPDFQEAHRLKEWFLQEGQNKPSVSISRETPIGGRTDNRKTISQIKDERLGTSEKPDWITVVATVIYMKHENFCYTACPIMYGDRACNKKVTNNGDGKWWCDKCDRAVDECDYRYIIQFQIQDHTGLTWVTAFQEAGEELIGVPAKELYHLRHENQNDERFMEIMRQVMFKKYMFKLKVKEETFSDEQRVKSTMVKVEKDFSESRFLLDSINKIKSGDSSCFASKAEIRTPYNGMNIAGSTTDTSRQHTPGAAGGGGYGTSANQAGQYGNQYGGSSLTATGSSGGHMFCNSCGAAGHCSTNCPSLMSGPVQSTGRSYAASLSSGGRVGGASGECFKCGQTGHWARECPAVNTGPSSYGNISGQPSGRYGGFPRHQVGGF